MTARHILIPIHDFNAGGTEAIAFRLAGAWLAAGRRVTVLAGASDGPMRPRVPAGAEVIMLQPQRRRSPISRFRLGGPMAHAAATIGPDAIFIPGNFHFILAAALKRALPDAVIVAKISNPLLSGDRPPLTPLHRAALGWWTRGIDRFVAMAPVLAARARAILAGRSITAIADPFLDDDGPVIARSGRPRDSSPLRLVAVGRLEPQKDMALAIRALATIRVQRPATLTILGDGSQRRALERLVASLSLCDAVTFAGHVADVPRHLADHDLFLLSSRFEGVPAVIGEALGAGLPFAATDCSAWLSDLARTQPTLGRIAPDRSAEALAAAALAVADSPFPSHIPLIEALRPHRLNPAAAAYLALFDAQFSRNGGISGQSAS